MTDTPTPNFGVDPSPALTELCRLLRFAQGEFALIVAVCNATEHRQALVKQLRQSCPIPFQELTLDPKADTLFSTLHQAIGDPPPAALMVYGLEAVQDVDSLLAATNQIREEFRQFPFPLVLWLTDHGQRHLIRTAPDFYTWASTVHFPTTPAYFQRFLDELIASVWQQVLTSQENRFLSTAELGLTPGSPRCQELETSLAALHQAGISLTPSQAAALAFVQGRIADNNTETARYHYEASLAQWQALATRPSPPAHSLENVGHLQFYLGLWWRNRSVRDRREFEPACQTACNYFAAAVATLTKAQCPEAAAKYINYWTEALHRLEQWDTLAQVSHQALELHQSRQDPIRQARALGFLAEVALHHQDWPTAQTQAQAALQLISPPTPSALSPSTPPDPTFLIWVNRFHRSWYLFSLGKAQCAQGQIDAAVATLEQATATTQPEYDPQLYSLVLGQLRQGYFQQGRYLDAFQTRRRQEAIESRFNFRAFVGAGRLQPKQTVANPALPTDALGQDAIVASGRKHDVQCLVHRLAQDEFTLTIIYGPSGVGKSSLLEAGLVPALEHERWEGRRVIPLRLWRYGNWAEELLAKLNDDEGHLQPAEAALDRIRQQTQQNRVMVLIFDQFEEFFFECDQPTSRHPFYQFLRQSLTTPFVKVVLSLREDYIHYLLECQRLLDLAIIDNNILDKKWLYYLGNFTPTEAKTVIADLTEPTPYVPAADLVEQVVADLTAEAGEVRPIELQIVGAQLQATGISTLAAYQTLGPSAKASLVQQYLTDVVTDCGPVEHQRLADLVLYLLTDEKGTRPRKTKANLAQDLRTLMPHTTLDEAAFALVLDILTQSGLVIHVPEAPEDRYQLVHDYLAAFIHQQQAPRLKEVMAELEQEKRQRQQAEAERATLAVANRKARRRLWLSSGLLAASILGTVVAIPSAISAYRVAQAESAKAQEEQAKAEKAQQAATDANQAAARARTAEEDANQAKTEAEKLATAAADRQKEAEQAAEQAQQDAQAAQVAVEAARTAEGVALSEQQAAQRQADEAQRQAEAAEQLRQTATAEALAAQQLAQSAQRQQEVARAGTQLEQRGAAILRLSDTRLSQAEALIEALQLGYALKAQLPDANAKSDQRTLENYPAYSPLLALRVTTNSLTEQASYKGDFRSSTLDNQGLITQDGGRSYSWSLNGTEQASFEGDFLSLTPDGQGLLTFSWGDAKIRLWNLSGAEQSSLEGIFSLMEDFKGFTPDGQGLVTSSFGKSHLWNLNGTGQASFEGEFQGFTPDGQGLVVYSSNDSKSRLWSLSGTEQASFDGSFQGFTSDGQRLVTFSWSDGESHLWSLSGAEQANFEGSFQGFTPDGQKLVTASFTEEGKSRLWSLSGTEQASFAGYFLGFTPDGQGLVTVAWSDGKSKLWSLSGTEQASFEGEFQGFTPDGQGLVTTSGNQIHLWNLNGTEQVRYEGSFQGFTPDGQGLVTTSGNQIHLWNLNGTEQVRYEGSFQGFTPDGQGLLAVQSGQTKRFALEASHLVGEQLLAWAPSQESLITYSESDRKSWMRSLDSTRQASFNGQFLRFTPDGQGLVTVFWSDYKIRLWTLNGLEQAGFDGQFRDFTPDGQGLVTSSRSNNETQLWSLNGLEQVRFDGDFFSFTPNGKGLIIYSCIEYECKSRLWSLNGVEQASFNGPFLSFTPDGQGLVTSSASGIRLWSLNGVEQANYEGNFRGFTPDGQGLVTTSGLSLNNEGERIRLWSLNGVEQANYEGKFRGFTPDGEGLVTYSMSTGPIRLWSLSGVEQASFEGKFQGFTPDRQGLVTSSESDGKIRLWSLSGVEQASFEGKFRGFTPDGEGLYIDSDYGTTILWSLSGARLAEFTGRMTSGPGREFTRFSDDGQYLITSLDDTTHRIWQLDNGLDDLLARGCNLLANHFRSNPSKREELGICLEHSL